MRPVPGDEALAGRSRNNSFGSITTPLARQTQPQMTYFTADEATMNENLDRAATTSASRLLREHMKRSSANFGVESMETISTVQHDSSDDEAEKARKKWKQGLMKKKISDEDMLSAYSPSQKSSVGESRNVSPSLGRRRPSHEAAPSQPATPYYLESPMLGSTPSFLRSRRASEIDFLTDGSQAILSSADEELVNSSTTIALDNNSQFVMPSITMPTRRPFTEKGKSMGRLKIMVAGDSGSGKTSLIKSITQSSPDIVHVDPFSTTPMTASQTQRRKTSRRRSTARDEPPSIGSTSKITEVFASTRPYPFWWSEAEEVTVLRRRKSSGGDTVLDRNICFVDTPGYNTGSSAADTITPVIDYIENQYRRTVNAELSDSELVGMLSGGGGPQVDVVLYLFNDKVKPVDIDYLSRLSRLTNVVPLVAYADTLSQDELKNLKVQIWSELKIANIRLPNLNLSPSLTPSAIYAVSSALARDDETMDASILMSPDYKQPLIPSDLSSLVERLLDPEVMHYLSHITAMKCVKILKSSQTTLAGDSIPLSLPGPSAGYGALQVLRPSIGPTSPYALARIADHTQREEQLARVRLSNWALDLQRAQERERMRFASLARHEQAVWHVDAWGELVREGTLTSFPLLNDAPVAASQDGQLLRREDADSHQYPQMGYGKQGSHNDPLGLLHFNEELISKTWAAVQIVSSVGVIGAVAFWFARNWRGQDGVALSLTGLIGDW